MGEASEDYRPPRRGFPLPNPPPCRGRRLMMPLRRIRTKRRPIHLHASAGKGALQADFSCLPPARDERVDDLVDVAALDAGVLQQAVVHLVQGPDDLAAAPLHPEPRHQPSNHADEIAPSGAECAPILLPQTPRDGGPGGGEVGHGMLSSNQTQLSAMI